MKKILKTLLITIGSLIGVILLSLVIFYIDWINLKTEPFRDPNGKIIPSSVASLEKVKLGGLEQTVLIRGKNINNPVLLFLHGGPGISEMGWVRKYNSELENYFIVVNWDQRGTGKSYSPIIPKETMNAEQFVSDAHELVSLLKKRYNKKKIYLIGHSWGSLLGVYLIKKYPKDFYAYVGIGQIANWIEGERISFNYTLKEAIKAKNEKAIQQLKNIELTNPEMSKKGAGDLAMIERKWLANFGGSTYGGNHLWNYFNTISLDEINLFDFVVYPFGMVFSLNNMLPDLLKNTDLIKSEMLKN